MNEDEIIYFWIQADTPKSRYKYNMLVPSLLIWNFEILKDGHFMKSEITKEPGHP
ncbi:hypothetical protein GCM10010913_29230 [Paenibacillus aceti]|uniref:Uncharacterized protein n=1 Tax=Paenibacillus aceti TaxID=1820010 RepID=A0ABQ1W0T6_9BACL|nr:hypothetical protein GCM10010913_29230 [Paenibacillus aceti]